MASLVSARKVRMVVRSQSQALESLGPVLQGLDAKIQNLHQRVQSMESLTWWGRLRWLVRGHQSETSAG